MDEKKLYPRGVESARVIPIIETRSPRAGGEKMLNESNKPLQKLKQLVNSNFKKRAFYKFETQ